MQPPLDGHGDQITEVSILTRPESRMQPDFLAQQLGIASFNPHPARKPDATRMIS